MVKFSKAIAITAQEMVRRFLTWARKTSLCLCWWDAVFSLCNQMTKSVTCPEELGGLASQVTVDYGQLAHQGRLAAATAEPEEVSSTTVIHHRRLIRTFHLSCLVFAQLCNWTYSLMKAEMSYSLITPLFLTAAPATWDQTEMFLFLHPLLRSSKTFPRCLQDCNVCKYCTNRRTALISFLYVTSCLKSFWLP